jgi:hypothetical protein
LTFIEIGTWLGEIASKIEEEKVEDCLPDAEPDAMPHDHCVWSQASPTSPVV